MPELEAVNRAIETISDPGTRLEYTTQRLWLHTRYGGRAMRLRSDRLWPAFPAGPLGMGGTEATAIAQVVLWLRDLPRRPLSWWQGNLHNGLGTQATIEALREGGYNDPLKTRCVLCEANEPHDWWCLDGVIGPCCLYGCCQPRPVGQPRKQQGAADE